MDHDFQIAFGQRFEITGRAQIGAVDKGEVAPVIGHEDLVFPSDRQVIVGLQPARRKQIGLFRGGDKAGVQPQHDIRVGPCAFKLEPRQQGRTVAHADEFQIAAAVGLEPLFDGRARPPFGDETVVGIDRQFRRLGPCGRCAHDARSKCKILHRILLLRRKVKGGCLS